MYTLLSAVEHYKKYQDFLIPNKEELKQITIGSFVKLVFSEKGKNERMWVRVTHIHGNILKGVLDNNPHNLKAIQYGDKALFTFDHIINIYESNIRKEVG